MKRNKTNAESHLKRLQTRLDAVNKELNGDGSKFTVKTRVNSSGPRVTILRLSLYEFASLLERANPPERAGTGEGEHGEEVGEAAEAHSPVRRAIVVIDEQHVNTERSA